MASGGYLGWLAITEDESIVASCGLWLMDWPGQMAGINTVRGNILNVYTQPEFRGRGLMRWLIEAALDWCGSNQIEVAILQGSDSKRSLYESIGFTEGNETPVWL
jgi:GNAT superfamily N-acetyltransferase